MFALSGSIAHAETQSGLFQEAQRGLCQVDVVFFLDFGIKVCPGTVTAGHQWL